MRKTIDFPKSQVEFLRERFKKKFPGDPFNFSCAVRLVIYDAMNGTTIMKTPKNSVYKCPMCEINPYDRVTMTGVCRECEIKAKTP